MGDYNHSILVDAKIMVSKNSPVTGQRVAVKSLPYQQYDLLKTPLSLALSANNSKTSSVAPMFYYQIIRCNFLQRLKIILWSGFRANLKLRKFNNDTIIVASLVKNSGSIHPSKYSC